MPHHYTKHWKSLLTTITKSQKPSEAFSFTQPAQELLTLGNRANYDGRVIAWAGRILKMTDSAVFRDLAHTIKEERTLSKFVGQLEIRVKDNSLLVDYNPISFEDLLDRYEEITRDEPKVLVDEQYKWMMIQRFQDNWADYEAGKKSFIEGFDEAPMANLVYQMVRPVFKEMKQERPKELEELLNGLFDESKGLKERMAAYVQGFDEVYKEISPERKAHQDERTISTLLALRYPEKYTFYKSNVYQMLCDGIGIEKRKVNQKMIHFQEIVREFIDDHLSRRPDLIDDHYKSLPPEAYKEEHHLTLAQNVFYCTLILYQRSSQPTIDTESTVNEPIDADYETTTMTPAHPLNTILFGPPGTGKTYSTLLRAMSIIDDRIYENPSEEEIDELKKRYKKLLNAGQIDFVTFHQSFTYEDFIEGIKPVMDSDSQEQEEDKKGFLEYEIADGAFKRLSEAARESTRLAAERGSADFILPREVLENANFTKISLGDSQNPNDRGIYEYCIQNGCMVIGYGDDHDFSNTHVEADVLEEFKIKEGEQVTNNSYGVIAIKCLKFWTKTGDVVLVSSGNKKIRAIGIVEGEYEFKSVPEIGYRHFRKVKWLYTDLNLPVQSVYERNFSQPTIYQMDRAKIKLDFFDSQTVGGKIKPHILIIDEINRGNIANIFGELITLIEDDKRSQAENEITVRLPYSKELFSVPANLHIIGTMNTADRSVEALDTALRRRFSFIEMPPKYDFPSFNQSVHGVTIKDLLMRINARIEKLLDKDHLIGHAYFLKVNAPVHADRELQLKLALQNKVLPLLQEYFFGDFGKIGLVMGKGFVVPVEVDGGSKNVFANFEHDASDQFAEKSIYKIVDVMAKEFNLGEALEQLMQ